MDVLPLVPVGSLVLVVVWLIWPVFQDAFSTPLTQSERDRGEDDLAESLFDTWAAHGDEPGLVARKQAA